MKNELINNEIAKLEAAASSQLKEAERLKKLSEMFPDIRKYVGRWNKIVYCSKSVNNKVNNFNNRYNCGCCSDSPMEIWPYLETPLGPIYSDPPMFMIGERHHLGVRLYPEWKESLKQTDIPEDIINKVSKLFQKEDEDDEEIY